MKGQQLDLERLKSMVLLKGKLVTANNISVRNIIS
jgi:hypothetical protein